MDDVLLSSKSLDWRTPPKLVRAIEQLGDRTPFQLDAAAQAGHNICPGYIGPGHPQHESCLETEPWGPRPVRTFMNPPYGREIWRFTEACIWQASLMPERDIWLLVPARTDTSWWNELVPHAFGVWFLKGRVKFLSADGEEMTSAPFPSAVVAIDGHLSRRRGPWTEYAWAWSQSVSG